MQEHEETLNVRAVEKYQTENQGGKNSQVLDEAASGLQQVSTLSDTIQPTKPPSSDEPRDRADDGLAMVQPAMSMLIPVPQDSSSTMPRTTNRPSTILITEDSADTPPPSPFVRALLTSPPTYLAPARIAHYHLCRWFCPLRYQQYMPARPDAILWLDTLIFLILSALTVIVLSKLSRSWTHIVYAIFRAVEKVSGIDMSWITEKFSPTRLPDNAYGQYWASGGAATAAALQGDRTRLRNMDTAMRAREIARRFGRPLRAEGARMPAPAHDRPQVEPGAAANVGDGPVPHVIEL